ncbi:MAG: HAD-IIA family hydrolase [Oligoflexia bacterium]|nr:HAD-IIA family hydrolase [Oligoflexia bacterium]MBF0365416.1 HAD-IIA family hydrolase [Oligoflexia bacterium]
MSTTTNQANLKAFSAVDLLSRYHTILLDAFGVITNTEGAIPGAIEFIDHLNASHTPYFILTNGASKLPKSMSAFFKKRGLNIPEQNIITSGSLLKSYFDHLDASEKYPLRALVIGTPESSEYAKLAGATIAPPQAPPEEIDAILICDEDDKNFIPTIDHALSTMIYRLEHNLPLKLVLSNPDTYYPRGENYYGITSGAIAAILESIIRERYHGLITNILPPSFVNLGKPQSMIFIEAFRRLGLDPMLASDKQKVVMVGDQLKTDILGANNFGIDSALVGTGVGKLDLSQELSRKLTPTHILPHGLKLSLNR